ncbi:protein unc-50 homolog isoform X2 [Juglans regia]|uniref:Protein unc-50 homolog isoform X2 n=1 Tax=Juglans regia TaxID=51240 RepID=A0A6P9EEE3_JUGRE|nr:protein unc-50 homolog isoform X2 [Juglans regia]
MLPTVSKGRSSSSTSRSNPMFFQYLRRIVKWQQMDVEYTFWQMLHLCTSPKVVYQHTKYHKQTKNQWARDDPAFVVICSILLMVATLAYCAAYGHSAGHAVYVVISVLLFHFLITGVVIATSCWFLTNSYLREEAPFNSHVVEQRVECVALSGEDHFLSISHWCCHCPFSYFDFEWLQSFEIFYELVLQSTFYDSVRLTLRYRHNEV